MTSELTFRSSFGGLWTDAEEAAELMARKLATGRLSAELAAAAESWIANGYAVLPGAVEHSLADELVADLERVWESRDPHVWAQSSYDGWKRLPEIEEESRPRLSDFYVYSAAARAVSFHPTITEFLRAVFEATPVAFQSLTFLVGSEQGMHNDTAYVVLNRPNHMAATWVALEDVREDAGPLMYYPGSHRAEEKLFSGKYKHWEPSRDGHNQHEEFARHIHTEARRLQSTETVFLARKGDVFIWSANLAHGAKEITNRKLTRMSHVTHYCPLGVVPNYFDYAPAHATLAIDGDGGAYYCSSRYRVGEYGPKA